MTPTQSSLARLPVSVRPAVEEPAFTVYTARDLERIPQIARLSADRRFDMQVVASVLPFRVNRYVLDELIDWDRVPDDPIFQLVFPQRGMLDDAHFTRVADLLRADAPKEELAAAIADVRAELNPHPAGQLELNIPRDADGNRIDGLQHKYRETVLFFPSQGQTCHSYCSFCFRWAQFVGDKSLRIASSEAQQLHRYLAAHPDVSDLLLTGGDPLVMKNAHLARYIEPLRESRLDHVQTLRIGTKSLAFWPHRWLGKEGDELLRLLESLVESGRHVALMAHYNHWRELDTPAAHEAIRRLRDAGVTIRAQGPLLAHINDDADVWARLWREQVRLGIVPYYLFVERDTGARQYFEVPLERVWHIYRDAMQRVSGLARTARGPSMSADPGKVEIQGVTEIAGERVFALRFIQARNPDWVQRPFFARYDPAATWLDQLQPAFGDTRWFWQEEYERRWSDKLGGPKTAH